MVYEQYEGSYCSCSLLCLCAEWDGLWYRLHIPSCILVRSVKISSMCSTVEFSVCFWPFPRIRFWTSLAVSLAVVDCVEFMLGLVCMGGLVVVSVSTRAFWVDLLAFR